MPLIQILHSLRQQIVKKIQIIIDLFNCVKLHKMVFSASNKFVRQKTRKSFASQTHTNFSYKTTLLVRLLLCTICCLFEVSLGTSCYANRKFPIVLNTSNDQNDNYLMAVTADSNAIYAGGYVKSTDYHTSSNEVATITRTNISTMSWAWRRVYSESTGALNTITALALNPSASKLACYGWTDNGGDGSSNGFVFSVDALSGWKTSEVMEIQHSNRVMEVQSARLTMDSQGTIYMAFYQISGNFYNGYESRLRVAAYNSNSSSLAWIKQQVSYYGRAGALVLGSSPQGTDYLYLAGSGGRENDDNDYWYASITQLNLDGTLYRQHYLGFEQSSSDGTRFDDRTKTFAIDQVHYWVESGSQSQHWLFGTTRSHEHTKKGTWFGIFKTEVKSGTNPLENSEYVKFNNGDVHDTSFVMGVYPQMVNDGSNYYMHLLYQKQDQSVHYLKARFDGSLSEPARQVMDSVWGKEAFFVAGSPLSTVTQTLQGYQAYVAGQAQKWQINGNNFDLGVKAGLILSTHSPSSTSCRSVNNNSKNINVNYYINGDLYESPNSQQAFSDLSLSTTIRTLNVDVAFPSNPINMSQCNAGDQTSIGGLVAGSYSDGPICFSNSASVSKSFTAPQVTSPVACSDTPWEYYPTLDATSPNSPLPIPDFLIQFDYPSQNQFTLASGSGNYPGPSLSTATYVVNVMAAEPTSGQEIQAFQLTISTMCCQSGSTTWNKPSITLSHTYNIGDASVTETTPLFTTSQPSCCVPLSYATTITPSAPAGVFTISSTNQREVSWFSSDLTASGPLINSPYTVRVTASIGCGMPDEYVEYTVTFQDPCPTATISLDSSNELLASQPILNYQLSSPEASISWDKTDSTTLAPAICGNFVFELWDITSGLEVALASPFTSVLTGAIYEVKVQSVDSAFIGTHNLRYKVYIDNYPAVKLDTDFDVQITVDCSIYTISLDLTNELLATQPILTYQISDPEANVSWDSTDVTTNAPTICGSLVFEIWDLTSGSEVALTTPFSSDFTGANHIAKVLTTNDNFVRTHTLRYKVYIDNHPAVELLTDFDIQIVPDCTSYSISLDSSNELLASQPVLTYKINSPEASISWDRTDSMTTAHASCGNLVYELWDITSGSEIALASPFTSVLTGAIHEVKVQSTDNAFIGTYNLRQKVYIDNYPAVKLDTDFDVQITVDCSSYTISLDASHPLNVPSLVFNQQVEENQQVISWSDSTITSDAIPACLPLVFEIWDITSGSEVSTASKNIITADFSSSTHTMNIFTNDFSQLGTHDIRFKTYLQQDPANLVNQDFKVNIQDPCLLSTTIVLDPSNLLLGSSPIQVYKVAYAAEVISWSDTEVQASFSSSCGSLVHEIWDVTSGSEISTTIDNIFTSNLATSTHSVTVQTSDTNFVGSYTLRYKVYIDNYPAGVVLMQDFDIQIDYCTPTSVIVSNDVPTSLSYTIRRSAEVSVAFTEFTVLPTGCNLSYQMISVSPTPPNTSLITFDGVNRSITVLGNNLFENGDHNSGQYVPQVYIATIKAFGDNNYDTGSSFQVSINVIDPCDLPSGTISFSNSFISANPLTYLIGDPAFTETFSITHPELTQAESIVSCPPITLTMTDDSLNPLTTFGALSFDPSLNQFKIESSDLADASANPFTMRVHAKYESAVYNYQVAGTFDFDVQVINSCLSPNSIVSQTQVNPPNYQFKDAYLGAPSNVVFTATPHVVSPSLCSVTYSCISNTGPRTDMCSINLGSTTISTFDTSTGDYTLETSDFDPFPTDPLNPVGVPPGTYQFTIQGTTGNKSATLTFNLIIEDPCLTNASLLIQEHIFDSTKSYVNMIDVNQDYLLNDAAITFAWNDLSFVSQEGGVTYSCGPLTTEIFKNDGLETPFDSSIFDDNRSGSPLNVFRVKFTTDMSKLGTYEVTYKVHLTNYPTIFVTSSSTYTVNIRDPCSAALLVINQGILTDQEYFLTDTALVYQIDAWTPNNSFCALSYAYSSNSPIPVNSITTFDSDPTQRQFIFTYTSDLSPSGLTFIDYTIQVTVSCGTITSQNSFNLKIKNPCVEPTLNWIQIPAVQPTYIYKIGSQEQKESLSVLGGNLSFKIALCGAMTLQAKLVSHTSNTDPTFVPTIQILDSTTSPIIFDSLNEEFTIFSDQNFWLGDHTIELSSISDTYPTVKIDPLTPVKLKLRFEACTITNTITQSIANYEISFGSEPKSVIISDFVAVGGDDCNYTWFDYNLVKVSAGNVQVQSSDYVNFDSAKKELTLHAQVPNTEELYFDFYVEAKLSDEVTLAQTNIFKVTVPIIPVPIQNNTAPYFEKEIPTSYQVVRDSSTGNAKAETIELGSWQDLENDQVTVLFGCGKGCPIIFDNASNSIEIPASAKPGNYSIEIKLEEQRDEDRKVQNYYMNIEIVQVLNEQYAIELDTNFTFVPPDLDPISFQIDSIDLYGLMKIDFTQMLKIPANFEQIDSDVLDLLLISNNFDSDAQEKQKFTWKVKEFTLTQMQIELNFEYPSVISSKEQKDILKVVVKDQSFFQAQSSLQQIEEGTYDQHIIFQLLENSAAIDILVGSLSTGEKGLNGALAANLMSNVLLSGSLNFLWGLINCIQVLAFFPLINLVMPANCQMLFSIIAKIATFDLVDISEYIQELEIFFGIPQKQTEPYHNNFEIMGFESLDPFKNLQLIFVAFIFFIFVPIIIRIFWVLFYCCSKMRVCIQKLERNLYWNSYIRFFLESYLELTIVALVRIQGFSFETRGESISTIFTMIVFLLCILLIPTFMVILFTSSPKKLRSSKFKARFGELYDQLDTKRKSSLFQPIIFLLRRLVYALSAVLLIRFNFFQIQILALKMTLLMIYTGYVSPYTTSYKNKLEICNETILLLAVYCLILFTEFVPDPEIRYQNGWAMIFVTFTLIAVNMAVVIATSIQDMVKKGKRGYKKYNYDKQIRLQRQNKIIQEKRLIYAQQQMKDPLRMVKSESFFSTNALTNQADTEDQFEILDTAAKVTEMRSESSSPLQIEIKQRRRFKSKQTLQQETKYLSNLESIEEKEERNADSQQRPHQETYVHNDVQVQEVDEGSLQDEVIDFTQRMGLGDYQRKVDNSVQYFQQKRGSIIDCDQEERSSPESQFTLETHRDGEMSKQRSLQIMDYADIMAKNHLEIISQKDYIKLHRTDTQRFDSEEEKFTPPKSSNELQINFFESREPPPQMEANPEYYPEQFTKQIQISHEENQSNYFDKLALDLEQSTRIQKTKSPDDNLSNEMLGYQRQANNFRSSNKFNYWLK